MNEWISVNERLPEPSLSKILVVSPGGTVNIYHKQPSARDWSAMSLLTIATHWQPVPAPPAPRDPCEQAYDHFFIAVHERGVPPNDFDCFKAGWMAARRWEQKP